MVSSTSEGLGRRAQPSSLAPVATYKPEEIQIVLLGAPRTGKTRLQSRYTLRQFVDIESEYAQRMGGHKHLRLPDGTDVHLIIHELRTGGHGQNRTAADPMIMRPGDMVRREAARRKRLLDESDAVMLCFNPWSRNSYDWINERVIDDIVYAGRERQTPDELGDLAGLVATRPLLKRSESTRSALSLSSKKLPPRPDDSANNFDEKSLFSGDDDLSGDERQDGDRIDFRGELKRISIVVEGSALRKAEFMIHQDDLPSPPKSPDVGLQAASNGSGLGRKLSTKLSTIRESDDSKAEQVTVAMDKNLIPDRRRDSGISVGSVETSSSTYSQNTMSTAVNSRRDSMTQYSDTHPIFREDENVLEAIADGVNDGEIEPTSRTVTRLSRAATLSRADSRSRTGSVSRNGTASRSASRSPVEDPEIPVLLVATQTDRLKDRGGNKERQVAPEQGQRLARKFGPNCAYIETSSKTNANVDEAYGIIVDQVMAKRQARRREELARAKVEAAAARELQARGQQSMGTRMSKSASRSCMPRWWVAIVQRWESWNVMGEYASGTRGGQTSNNDSGVEIGEDVWGERFEIISPRQNRRESNRPAPSAVSDASQRSKRQTEPPPQMQRQLLVDKERAKSELSRRTISHNPKMDTSLMSELKTIPLEPLVKEARKEGATNKQFSAVEVEKVFTMAVDPMEEQITPTAPPAPALKAPEKVYSPDGNGVFKTPTATLAAMAPGPGSSESSVQATRQRRITEQILAGLSHNPTPEDYPTKPSIFGDKAGQGSLSILRALTKRRAKKPGDGVWETHVSEYAPRLPTLVFEDIDLDVKHVSLPSFSRAMDLDSPGGEQVSMFLTQGTISGSYMMMMSPRSRAQGPRAFGKRPSSARASSGVLTALAAPGRTGPSDVITTGPQDTSVSGIEPTADSTAIPAPLKLSLFPKSSPNGRAHSPPPTARKVRPPPIPSVPEQKTTTTTRTITPDSLPPFYSVKAAEPTVTVTAIERPGTPDSEERQPRGESPDARRPATRRGPVAARKASSPPKRPEQVFMMPPPPPAAKMGLQRPGSESTPIWI